MKQSRIIAIHLINDFSGSALVFSQALQTLQHQGHEVHLFTTTPSGNGFLNHITGIFPQTITYQRSGYKLFHLALFLFSQVSLFFQVLFFVRKSDIVYINSILPFGAAFAGWLMGGSVVYHIHEVPIHRKFFKMWILLFVKITATQCIYVSRFVQQCSPLLNKGTVIYNALSAKFIKKAQEHQVSMNKPFTVLMLCSLKRCKGLFEFIKCAHRLPNFRFELVLNASKHEIDAYFANQVMPVNLTLYRAHSNVHPFYARASVVVNLSLPNHCIETFGMTVLEAMYYKIPVLIPAAGGITELVEHGVNGFHVNSRKLDTVIEKINYLASHRESYQKMSEAAYQKAHDFNPSKFKQSIIEQFNLIQEKYSLLKQNIPAI